MPNTNLLRHSPCQLGTAQPSCASLAQALQDMPGLEKRANPNPAPCRITRAAERVEKSFCHQAGQNRGHFQGFSLSQGWIQGIQDKMLLLHQGQTSCHYTAPLSSGLSQFSSNWLKALLQIQISCLFRDTGRKRRISALFQLEILREEEMMICISPSSYFLISLRNHSREQWLKCFIAEFIFISCLLSLPVVCLPLPFMLCSLDLSIL